MNLAASLTGMARSGLGAPALLIVILMMVVVPLPPFALDVFFTFNIALSLVVLLATVYSERPLDFAVFPTVLLVTTLLRLALNVASTRVVLLHGHAGPDAAGKVIEAFGHFVVGGNYAVGLVVFAILTIINFVVVTKGAGRVSEVSARFTLDAMPGKQMAIDADLNAGVIDQAEAKRRPRRGGPGSRLLRLHGRRQQVRARRRHRRHSDPVHQHARRHRHRHPATRPAAGRGGPVLHAADHRRRPGGATAGAAAVHRRRHHGHPRLRLPGHRPTGHPTAVRQPANPGRHRRHHRHVGADSGYAQSGVLGLSGGAGYMAWRLSQRHRTAALGGRRRRSCRASGTAESAETREVGWDDVPPLDTIGMEVGYRLIALVDRNQNGQLLGRIKGVRKKLSQELGFLIPPVHIRDNLDLAPTAYRITLLGVTAAESEAFPDRQLAINPGQVHSPLPGIPTQDPAFKLPAVWIEPDLREQAQTLGYTVVDASTVIATHLNQILLGHAHELLGHEETQQLLDRLAQAMPRLVQDLVPKTLALRVVVRVLQNLLVEQVPIRDMRTIAETLAEHGSKSQDPDVLTAAVRAALGRMIVQNINSLEDELSVITLSAELEQILLRTLQMGRDEQAPLEPGLAERLHKALLETAQKQELVGQPAVLLVPDVIRVMLARFVRHGIPNLHVLAFSEIPEDKKLKVIATVGK
jgi:flagellar biosynthesis protein FlhA